MDPRESGDPPLSFVGFSAAGARIAPCPVPVPAADDCSAGSAPPDHNDGGGRMQAMERDALALSVTETTMQDWEAATTALHAGAARACPSVQGALAPHPRPPRPEILPARSLQQRPLRVVSAAPGPRGALWSGWWR